MPTIDTSRSEAHFSGPPSSKTQRTDENRQIISEQLYPDDSESSVQKIKLYDDLPDIKNLLSAVTEGWLRYNQILTKLDLPANPSTVHDEAELQDQSLAMAILFSDRIQQVNATVLANGTHYLDDQLDPPDKKKHRELLLEHIFDPSKFVNNWGKFGQLHTYLADLAEDRDRFNRGCHKMYLGSLFLGDDSQEPFIRNQFENYRQFSMQFLEASMRSELNKIDPSVYALTNKTVMECFCPKDEQAEITELWSVLYAPAVFLADLEKEKEQQELSPPSCLPKTEQLAEAIRISSSLLADSSSISIARKFQCKFVVGIFNRFMPTEIQQAYAQAMTRISITD